MPIDNFGKKPTNIAWHLCCWIVASIEQELSTLLSIPLEPFVLLNDVIDDLKPNIIDVRIFLF